MMSIHEEAVRLRAEIARLTGELRAVRSNAEAEIDVLRWGLNEARTQRDAVSFRNGTAEEEIRTLRDRLERANSAKWAEVAGNVATRALSDAWVQLRSDHAHDPEDEGTLAEEIATLQRVWHAAEDDLSDARAKLLRERRDHADAKASLASVRSQLHNLPRSETADRIEALIAAALEKKEKGNA